VSFRVTNRPFQRLTTMCEEDAGAGRRLLDEAMRRTVAQRTAWVRQFVWAGRCAPGPDDLRVEGAVDMRRRIGVVAEAYRPPPPVRRFDTERAQSPGRLIEPFARRRPVVYAGGSRYVTTAEGWEHAAGDIEGPRCPSDPVWLLDALRYAVDCEATGEGEVSARLDLCDAADVDRSGILPASWWRAAVRPPAWRRREGRLGRVPCVVALGDDGAIARMSYAALPASDGAGLRWATTEFVEFGVPVEIPDLMGAGAGAGAARGRAPRVPATR
jgi:hypothetical protein